jgi:hypothetical protein
MEAFWGVLEWGANTILFIWMGLVLAIVLPPSHYDIAYIRRPMVLVPSDVGYMILLFVWLQVRGLGWGGGGGREVYGWEPYGQRVGLCA